MKINLLLSPKNRELSIIPMPVEHAELDDALADAIKRKGIYLELTAYQYSLWEYTERMRNLLAGNTV
jgi:hypothetical protein